MRTGWPNGGGCDYPTGGAGSVRDFAQTITPQYGVTGIPTELEILLHRILEGVQASKPIPPPKTGITDMETLLRGLLSGIQAGAPWARPGLIRRD